MNDAMPESGETSLRADGIVKGYRLGRKHIPVLREVSLAVRPGEGLCICGASGSGKSTLLHVIGGLDRPDAGTVTCEVDDVYALSERRRARLRSTRIGFVFQAYHLLPELTLVENVGLPLRRWAGSEIALSGKDGRVAQLLERVGLSHRGDHRPAECSGGEQQRAALARALVNQPHIVLADEPTGNLDSRTGAQVLDLLFDLVKEEGRAMIMVTHDEQVAERCDRTEHLVDGRLAAAG